MLKYYLVLCCAAFALAEDKYTDKYDKIDLDEILGNKRLLQAYVNCILDKGKCTPEGKELKGKSLINSEHSAGQMSLISLKPKCWRLKYQFNGFQFETLDKKKKIMSLLYVTSI